MDLIALIRSKARSFEGTTSQRGIESIIHHIEIAESHFERSKDLGEHLYTDVVYRTNQAFEGALKEAYRVLTGTDPVKKKPFDVESYFESAGILKERVLSQFRNYRTEWRNKSTHDYQLFFSSQEAMLAIVSVSAFFAILLDQMLEKHFFEAEKERLSKIAKSIFSDVRNYRSMGFMHQCVELLTHFSTQLRMETPKGTVLLEQELVGKLSGFIAAADADIRISIDKPIQYGSSQLRLDLLLEKGDASVIVELKRSQTEWARRAREGIEQIRHYLIACNLHQGIVFIPALLPDKRQAVKEHALDAPHGQLQIAVVHPS
jgi:hypothetical protein